MNNTVIFLSDCKNIPSKLKKLDLFVLSSFYERFPVLILEALCSGVPVITTSVNSIPEAIKDKFNGLIVEPGKVESLTKPNEITCNNYELRSNWKL